MGPKSKKLKSKAKKSDQNDEIRLPSDREVALRAKLEQKQHDLTEFKMRVYKAEEQHKWLEREAHRLRIETSEYKQFMLRKKNLRETQMVTLSDYHKEEIGNINQCKDNMTEKYHQRKKELQMQLIEKSKLLRDAQRELEDMEGYRIIREQQSDEIKLLKYEVKQMRAEQVHEIDRFKLDFKKEVEQNQILEEIQLAEFEEQAKLEVEKYLYERTINIQNENTELRRKLQSILKRQEQLNKLREKLEEEQLDLIVQLKLTTDLKKIRLDKTSGNLPKKFLRYH